MLVAVVIHTWWGLWGLRTVAGSTLVPLDQKFTNMPKYVEKMGDNPRALCGRSLPPLREQTDRCSGDQIHLMKFFIKWRRAGAHLGSLDTESLTEVDDPTPHKGAAVLACHDRGRRGVGAEDMPGWSGGSSAWIGVRKIIMTGIERCIASTAESGAGVHSDLTSQTGTRTSTRHQAPRNRGSRSADDCGTDGC